MRRHLLTVLVGSLLLIPAALSAQTAASTPSAESIFKALDDRQSNCTRIVATAVVETFRTDWYFREFDLVVKKVLEPDAEVRSDAEIQKWSHKSLSVVDMTLGQNDWRIEAQGLAGGGDPWFSPVAIAVAYDPARQHRLTAADERYVYDFSRAEGDPRLTIAARRDQRAKYLDGPYSAWLALAFAPKWSMFTGAEAAGTCKILPPHEVEGMILLEAAYIAPGKVTALHEVRLWLAPDLTPRRCEWFTCDVNQPDSGARTVQVWDGYAETETETGTSFPSRYRGETFYYWPAVATTHTETQIVEFLDYPANTTIPQPDRPWLPPGTFVVPTPVVLGEDPVLGTLHQRSHAVTIQRQRFEKETCPEPDALAARPIGQADLDTRLQKYGLSKP